VTLFPVKPADLEVAWLAEVLNRPSLESFTAERMTGGFWSHMVRLSLSPSSGGPNSVVAKFANPSDQSRLINSTFEFSRVELGFYSDAAAETPVRSPKCYGSFHSDDYQDYVIIMEDLGADQLNQLEGCPPDEAAAIVDALARLHARWWADPSLEELPWLHGPTDPVVAERLPFVMSMVSEAAFQNLKSIPVEISDAWPKILEELPGLLGRLANQPSTLAHGDVRLSNLFVLEPDQADAAETQIAFVDWQAARHTHGCYDLAYFLTQSLSTEIRREHEKSLIQRYRSSLINNGVEAPSIKELNVAYKLCAIYCLVYPMIAASSAEGGASPEALEIAERAFTSVIDIGALDLL
jgi:hypothetical protein